MILGKNAIARGLKFDETWKFDFYDGQLAFDALKLGLKVGVEPIACVHESAGYGVNSHLSQYMNDQLKFIEKNLKKSEKHLSFAADNGKFMCKGNETPLHQQTKEVKYYEHYYEQQDG